MVARGEIGLLIVQIGYNSTSYVTSAGLKIAIWAILFNTIVGPIVVGVLIKFRGREIAEGGWGVVTGGGGGEKEAEGEGEEGRVEGQTGGSDQ